MVPESTNRVVSSYTNKGQSIRFYPLFLRLTSSFPINSPRDIHERDGQVHQGFSAINGYIKRTSPKFHIHGHRHHFRQTTIAQTIIIAIYGHKTIDIVSRMLRRWNYLIFFAHNSTLGSYMDIICLTRCSKNN